MIKLESMEIDNSMLSSFIIALFKYPNRSGDRFNNNPATDMKNVKLYNKSIEESIFYIPHKFKLTLLNLSVRLNYRN